jgi:hypothetical protein
MIPLRPPSSVKAAISTLKQRLLKNKVRKARLRVLHRLLLLHAHAHVVRARAKV